MKSIYLISTAIIAVCYGYARIGSGHSAGPRSTGIAQCDGRSGCDRHRADDASSGCRTCRSPSPPSPPRACRNARSATRRPAFQHLAERDAGWRHALLRHVQVLSAYIRGIGANDFAFNLDPGVGIYLDGVYLARTVGREPGSAGRRADRGAARPAGHALRPQHDRRRDQHRHPCAGPTTSWSAAILPTGSFDRIRDPRHGRHPDFATPSRMASPAASTTATAMSGTFPIPDPLRPIANSRRL